MKDKLPKLISKPIKGYPEEEWSKYTMNHIARIENLDRFRHLANTPEAKAKRLKHHLGVKRPDSMRQKLSKTRTGMKIGQVPSKYVPVIATNVKTGEEIKFDGQVLAAEQLNLTTPNINSVLKGRQRTTAGWTFKYA
jgi:hypothetical protein